VTRQRFAASVEDGLAPILKGYRHYVLTDWSLNKDEKRYRLQLVRDLESLILAGKK
jgi:hypothetical protein